MTDQELADALGLTAEEATAIIPKLEPEERVNYERLITIGQLLAAGHVASGVIVLPDRQEMKAMREITEATVEAIKPILARKGPGVQGAVLADLLAIWLAGHPKAVREALIEMHVKMVRELVPVNAKLMGTEVVTKDEAAKIRDAVREIETGRVAEGVTLLRQTMKWAGYDVPPFRVEARERPPRGKER